MCHDRATGIPEEWRKWFGRLAPAIPTEVPLIRADQVIEQ